MNNSNAKRGFGFYATVLAAVLAIAAGVYFLMIHGTFGLDSTHNGNCFHIAIVALLLAGGALSAVLAVMHHAGIASALVTAASGISLCVFIHQCYWYIVDVIVGIDEKHGFDPRFIIFTVLAVLPFLVGEIAIYTRKERKTA